ncbi:MAG: DUF3106 domain-containing protein [Nitrospirota bacterium]
MDKRPRPIWTPFGIEIKKILIAAAAASALVMGIYLAQGEEVKTQPAAPAQPAPVKPASKPIPRKTLKTQSVQERWDSLSEEEKQDILENYEMWKSMTPERRARLKNAYKVFRSLPPAKRQELRDRYRRLKNLPPEKKTKVMSTVERWRTMTPQQKQEYRDGVAKFNALPPDKKEEIRSKLRSLKDLPPDEAAKNKEKIRKELKDQGIILPRREPIEVRPVPPNAPVAPGAAPTK